MHGVRNDAGNIIAKRGSHATVALELLIYREFLACLPLSSLCVIGSLEDTEGEQWLFLEDAGDELFSAHVPEHREAVAKWLAGLHIGALSLLARAQLPVRDASFYYDLLLRVRAIALQSHANPALTPVGHAALDKIEEVTVALDVRWAELDAFCRQIPATLVHGDFVEKNVRVRADHQGQLAVYVFDWEMAGLGCPAPDLAMIHSGGHDDDIRAYLTVAAKCGKSFGEHEVRRMAHVGAIFRYVASLKWACKSLALKRPERAVKKVSHYVARLHELASQLD